MSFQELLCRKAEQYVHSGIIAFLMMVLGINLLMGGLIGTVRARARSILGLILTITGFLVLSAGFIMVVHYDRRRSWHLKEIEKSAFFRNRKITIKTQDELVKGLTDESSEK